MLFWLVVIFSIYTFLKIYISVMEIGYVTSLKSKEPILLDPKKYIEAASYTIRKERVNLVESFVEYLLFLFWIFVGFKYLQSITGADDSYKSNIIFLALFFLINFIVTLPFDYYRKFVIDKAFGFNKMSVKMWIGDILKELIMSLIIGGILVLFLIYVIKNYQLWWLWGFIFSFLVAIFVLFIYPTIIAPLFNKFEPLKDKELNDDIEALLNRVGLKSNGVFVMDASKRDSRLNAYFGGLGKSKRVVLFDTLLNKLNKNELLAVLGHELGHFSNKDVLKNIVIFAIFLFITFYILGHLPKELFFDMGVFDTAGVKIAMIFLILPLINFFFLPIIGYFSRKNEYRADEFGAKLVTNQDLINALLKLVSENRSFPKAHKLKIFFYYTHPPIIERLEALGYKEEKEGILDLIKSVKDESF